MAPKRKAELFTSAPVLKKLKASEPSTVNKKKTKKASVGIEKSVVQKEISGVDSLDLSNVSVSKKGDKWNLKIASWNVNGVRAWCQKKGLSYVQREDADIFCMQETKCDLVKLPSEVKLKGYNDYWSSAEKSGYSGTGMLSKVKPIKVTYGIGGKEFDTEGRVITAEFEKFFFVTAYVPNSGSALARLEYRTSQWDVAFHKYLMQLEEKKPIIVCGDLNVSFLDIDLANPKSNQRNSGFTKEERDSFGKLLNSSFVDSFRHLYPSAKGAYTYWSYMGTSRAKNVGWRLDYCLISKSLVGGLCDVVHRQAVHGSDHCPIVLFLHL